MTGVMCRQWGVVIAMIREVKGGAVAVGRVEHGDLQVIRLVQRLLPAAGDGACVRIGQKGLHLSGLALPVETGRSSNAGPTRAAALWDAVSWRLKRTGSNAELDL